MTISYRPAVEDDMRFIIETTAKVRWPHGSAFRDWRAVTDVEVRRQLAEGGCAWVAEAGGVILGFALARADRVLTMLYVKRDFRGAGIGLELVAAAGADVARAVAPTPSLLAWVKFHGRWPVAA